MSRNICTVRELWTEGHVGLAGYPSIAHLISRRLRIVKYVRSLISAVQSAEAAIDRAEEERGTRSIDAFSKHLHRKKSV
ncbi:hypothetical protein PHMEG_00012271 [Phytophthora megakarya]|uniref:Uncharacterized protein n=1 Tax=Phytophthora megakarya TaxID=4795 RepID=A0A225WBR7_9STRA|nr:hypothetical protein PHMEG_00012271 [Phytophthora megakarya]